MRWPVLAALLPALACHDAGDDALAKVKAQYAALLSVGTPAQSRDFERLVKELDAIPASSRARPEAEKLKKAIEAARAGRVERPLAVAAAPLEDLGAPKLQAQLEATRTGCEGLARELGGKQGDERTKKLELLDACRRRTDDLVEQLEHGAADGGLR